VNELARQKLILALDFDSLPPALAVAQAPSSVVGIFKINIHLFTAEGPSAVAQLDKLGCEIFLDLKFHDIPNTVSRAVEAAVRLDVQMLTVHASGGREMLTAAARAAEEEAQKLGRQPPLLLGVTVLTSLNSGELSEVGMDPNIGSQVERLALLATRCGLGGLVCSPLELVFLRQILPRATRLVTPGTRIAFVTESRCRARCFPNTPLNCFQSQHLATPRHIKVLKICCPSVIFKLLPPCLEAAGLSDLTRIFKD
jgi:orotidine-5'-phosphate decarboxylase